MAILAECPMCHKRQSVRNRRCLCGEDLDRQKRSKKIKYWIVYRIPGGKQRWEPVGYSIEAARASEGKRRAQNKENRILDVKPETKMTFSKLTEWFLNLEKVKAKAYYPTLTYNLASFNAEFGNVIVSQIKPTDLENYQAKQKAAGYSDSYVDQQIGAARTMIYKAFDNDLVGGDLLKVFRKAKKLLKRDANRRDKVLSYPDDYERLIAALPRHTRPIVEMGFRTGMRRGEIVSLTWDKVDLENRMIRLGAKDTKEGRAKKVPISRTLQTVLMHLPTRLRGIDTDNHIFQYRGEPIKGDIRKSLENACGEANIPYGRFEQGGFIFHDLRHTFTTIARRAGIPRNVIMVITGHTANDMNFRYDTVDEEDLLKAIDQMEDYLANVSKNVSRDSIQTKKGASPNQLTP
jgi:integrase